MPESTIQTPSGNVIRQRMAGLEQRGVPVELKCGRCDQLTETTTPPEDVNEESQKTICRECVEALL